MERGLVVGLVTEVLWLSPAVVTVARDGPLAGGAFGKDEMCKVGKSP